MTSELYYLHDKLPRKLGGFFPEPLSLKTSQQFILYEMIPG